MKNKRPGRRASAKDVLTGRVSASWGELFDLVHELNPTGRELDAAVGRAESRRAQAAARLEAARAAAGAGDWKRTGTLVDSLSAADLDAGAAPELDALRSASLRARERSMIEALLDGADAKGDLVSARYAALRLSRETEDEQSAAWSARHRDLERRVCEQWRIATEPLDPGRHFLRKVPDTSFTYALRRCVSPDCKLAVFVAAEGGWLFLELLDLERAVVAAPRPSGRRRKTFGTGRGGSRSA